MAARKPLRAVTAADAPRVALSVGDAAERGTHRDLLVAMRQRIATAVQDPSCPPRALAPLTRRLQDIAAEIKALDALAAEEEADSDIGDGAWDAEAL